MNYVPRCATTGPAAAAGPAAAVERYYRWHAPIYDLTRWTFLFGRSEILGMISAGPAPESVLEIGCGTGRNLAQLAKCFPKARFTGVDLSEHMLARAAARELHRKAEVRFVRMTYDQPLHLTPASDLVLFSYSLSMMNPGWDSALKAADRDLKPGGRLAVVDFAGTPLGWFRRWMWRNHVRLDVHLTSTLKRLFPSSVVVERRAYAGAWSYFLFLGTKPLAPPPGA
jgi:S-adenosylmethionine-diacylgycerolhomoserine-N-methlytransferase